MPHWEIGGRRWKIEASLRPSILNPSTWFGKHQRETYFRWLRWLAAAIAAVWVLWFVYVAWFSQPNAGAPIEIVIEEGMTGSEVRHLLSSSHLVSGVGYRVYSMLDRSTNRFIAATYQFRKGTSYRDIARMLASGPERRELKLRFVEGDTLDEEISALANHGVSVASSTGLIGASGNAAAFDRTLIAQYPFLAGIPEGMSLEGYLFPDTYRVWEDDVFDTIVYKQLDAFEQKVIKPLADEQRKSGMTWHEIITLASVVEREAPHNDVDRKIIAGIFLNRLNIGMALQSDATINYFTQSGRGRSTFADLAINSPYNTYKYPGLPPGPINNPSLAAIKAVLEPAETDYYFFLSDNQGRMYYGRNGAEHQRNRGAAYGE